MPTVRIACKVGHADALVRFHTTVWVLERAGQVTTSLSDDGDELVATATVAAARAGRIRQILRPLLDFPYRDDAGELVLDVEVLETPP